MGQPETPSYVRALERIRDSTRPENRPRVFSLCGREWDLLETVFAPQYVGTTEIMMDMLGLLDPEEHACQGSFLEIGCGTGVVAVTAALAGCRPVVASDINPEAVENTLLNVRRHDVADRVEVLRSDLFEALPAEQRFDTVIWSSPYIRAPDDYHFGSRLERAYLDPGYVAHRRYLLEAPRRVTPTGRALLHFSSRGDFDGLRRIAEETRRHLRVLRTRTVPDRGEPVENMLVEIRADDLDAAPG